MMSSSSTNMEPWLMLPSYDDRNTTKLYSLAEKKVVSIKKETAAPAWAQGRVIHMGCTHGWMASFNMFNRQTFLSNPITGRHIKLPDIHTFLKSPYDPISIILTSSPDAHDCRAIMTSDRSYKQPIAVCFPAHTTTNWLPVDLAVYDPKQIVYSTRQSLLFCITWGDGDEDKDEGVLECWDLESPSFVWKVPLLIDEDKDDDRPLYLVMDEHSDRLFLVMRHVLGHVQRDGSHLKSLCANLGDKFPHKTISFDVYEIDAKKGKLIYMEGSLDGLAMFVGGNHSFALPAAEFNLNPDSIYFVEDYYQQNYTMTQDGDITHNDHDFGIFNYLERKISSIYYPSQLSYISRIAPAFWFTPTHH